MQAALPHAREFVELSAGKCHFCLDGPATGKDLLLIHGATVPMWQFDGLVPLFNRRGFRTLRLDLFGHGYSARPGVRHDYALFTCQVLELLDYLEVADGVHLLGHSLGAAIATRLVLADPERFGSLVMTAPVLNFMATTPAARLLRVPLLGVLLVDHYVVPMLVRRRTRRYRDIQHGRFVSMFRDQFRVPGFGRSLLALMRSDALADQRTSYAALAKLANPVLILAASGDRIATPAHMRMLYELLPGARHHVIDHADHALVLTHPAQVASHALRFLC